MESITGWHTLESFRFHMRISNLRPRLPFIIGPLLLYNSRPAVDDLVADLNILFLPLAMKGLRPLVKIVCHRRGGNAVRIRLIRQNVARYRPILHTMDHSLSNRRDEDIAAWIRLLKIFPLTSRIASNRSCGIHAGLSF